MTSSYANLAKSRVVTTPTSSAIPQRHFAKVDDSFGGGAGAADFLGHGVEREALGASDGVKSFKEAV